MSSHTVSIFRKIYNFFFKMKKPAKTIKVLNDA